MTPAAPGPGGPNGARLHGPRLDQVRADLDLALRLADRADAITVAAFERADLVVETKADRTPVSEADRAVELEIRAGLEQERPGDRVVGEEYGDTGSGPRRWIVDPIDGTKNFVRRIPVWATLLALEVDGVVTVGVVSAPALGRRWWAGRGLGAYSSSALSGADAAAGNPAGAGDAAGAGDPAGAGDAAGAGDPAGAGDAAGAGDPAGAGDAVGAGGRRLSVSRVADLADAHLSGAALSSWDDWGGPAVYEQLALACYADRSFGDFWSHMLVAEGVCDIGLDPIASLWDLAALSVIVEEAGGVFTDFGGVARADGGSAISSNGLVHEAARSVLVKGRSS